MTSQSGGRAVRGARNSKWAVLLCGVSAVSLMSAMPAAAQEAEEDLTQEVVVVQGVRASLERAMDIKRDANGVLDAISAEDIGKFPDTNLAESLQRITGVSIDRVNGEGSQITVRGFGPDFNLVTLNGRTMPTAEANVVGSRGNYNGGGSRAFDFSNLASEGVSALEVYKTGQALLPSGGIGATVNIRTARPLDTGTKATFGAKIVNDTSVEAGDDYTPELSGLASWVDNSERFGVSLFGSYSKRDSGAPTQQINDWIVREAGVDGSIHPSYTRAGGTTSIENPPAPGQLYAIAQDSRYDFSDLSRERINGQLVLQFKPMDTLTLTGDYTYAQNKSEEQRYEQTNWFATPLDQIIFDNDGPVATAVFMQENNLVAKDIGFEQTSRASKDELKSLGFNADWEVSDRGRIVLDAHSSKATTGGDNPLGHSATFVTFGAPVISQHSVDYRSGSPIQSYLIDDSFRGNGNGVLDAGDLGTQVQRSYLANIDHKVDEIDLRYVWDFDNSSLTFGGNYRDTELTRYTRSTQQDLGSWGISNPGDVEQYAPGMVQTYCLSCLYDDVPVGQADIAFRADATALFPIFEQAYSGNAVTVSETDDKVQEQISSLFAQFDMESELVGHTARLSAGVRYEETEVKSISEQSVPSGILWTADNDFLVQQSGTKEAISGSGSYDHILPNFDLSVDLMDNLVGRVSFSKTIGRAAYSNLYASTEVDTPNRPSALGGGWTGSSQNPALVPLESDNFDVSLEWYYGDTSYVSVGYFDKKVKNFIGNGAVDRNLFGILDQTSGVDGSRSGDALDIISNLGVDRSEANLFTLVALIDVNGGDLAAAQAEFEANLVGNALPQTYVDQILAAYDVTADGSDPLATFTVTQPINNREGNIDGMEFAWQHFFGDTGFGFQANYTMVNGDVELDPAGSIDEEQFALVGLSDTANLTAIYEKYGFSARLAYNWRDTFLQETNAGDDRSGIYVEDYGQYDLSVSYDINDRFSVSFEGVNLTGEDQRTYHRVPEEVYYVYELSPRYMVGARYKF
jgi:TonB-dependent receptor